MDILFICLPFRPMSVPARHRYICLHSFGVWPLCVSISPESVGFIPTLKAVGYIKLYHCPYRGRLLICDSSKEPRDRWVFGEDNRAWNMKEHNNLIFVFKGVGLMAGYRHNPFLAVSSTVTNKTSDYKTNTWEERQPLIHSKSNRYEIKKNFQ